MTYTFFHETVDLFWQSVEMGHTPAPGYARSDCFVGRRITSGILMHLFGISCGQASKDFSLYQQLAVGNLIYNRNQKAYFPSESFAPRFIRGTSEEYLRLIEAGSCLGQSIVLSITSTGVGVELLHPPERKLHFPVLRLVHLAIREKCQLTID